MRFLGVTKSEKKIIKSTGCMKPFDSTIPLAEVYSQQNLIQVLWFNIQCILERIYIQVLQKQCLFSLFRGGGPKFGKSYLCHTLTLPNGLLLVIYRTAVWRSTLGHTIQILYRLQNAVPPTHSPKVYYYQTNILHNIQTEGSGYYGKGQIMKYKGAVHIRFCVAFWLTFFFFPFVLLFS